MTILEKITKTNIAYSPDTLDPRQYSPKVFLNNLDYFGVNQRNGLRLLGAAVGDGILDPSIWQKEGIISKKIAAKITPLPTLKLSKIATSKVDGFQKLLFHTQDNLTVETVIIPLHKNGCVSICVSSQVGCVMGCVFCATAKMNNRRNLESWEIVDQLQQARHIAQESGRKVTGVVFMGMGEPFLNYANVMKAAELFCYPVHNAISSKAITISTVGILDKIIKFTDERRPFRLSISLGAAIDEKRKQLVPIAARTPVNQIMLAAKNYALIHNERVMLSYVCVPEVNMQNEDVLALNKLIGDTPVRLDLIEVNDTSKSYRRPTEDEFNNFRSALCQTLKQPVVRRYSGGADINAACGTLAG
jgi:23S rRNA (adenine2503-C2)-methyltransferase